MKTEEKPTLLDTIKGIEQPAQKVIKNTSLKRLIWIIGAPILLLILLSAVKKANKGEPLGEKRKTDSVQEIKVPTNGDIAVAGTPSVSIEIWDPEGIVHKDSMILDTNFKMMRVPSWAANKSLEYRRLVEWYGQTIDIMLEDGRVVTVGPAYEDPDLDWSDYIGSKVRITPGMNVNENFGVLYFVQRQKTN